MIYRRKILDTIEKYIKSKEIIVLTGMRRVGKTTLCKIIYNGIKSENKAFLDLENPIHQKVFEESNFDNIIFNLKDYGIDPRKKIYIFLDEIQAMPTIVKAVKYLHDNHDIKFFLTGSSSYYLKNLFPESLAGRKFVFEIFPLDFEEFLNFKNIKRDFQGTFADKDKNKRIVFHEKVKKLYEEYLEYGGFPAVVLASGAEEKKMMLDDIFKSYFEKEVRVLADFREIRAFRDLMLILMQRAGSKIEITKLASEVGVSRETVYSFISFLEGTYFASFITPFSYNVDREVSGARKVYICDTGILNHFAKVSKGSLFENSVFLNLRKYGKINYYQKRTGAEIDFIVNKKIAFEVKMKGVESDLRKLAKIASLLKLRQYYLITMEFKKDSRHIPASELVGSTSKCNTSSKIEVCNTNILRLRRES